MPKLKRITALINWILIVAVVLTSIFTFLLSLERFNGGFSALISTAFPEKISPEALKSKYIERPIRILIVPGHDNINSGAQFGELREADANIAVAGYLYDYLKYNPKFETLVTRDLGTGEYIPVLKTYFEENDEAIEKYMEEKTEHVNAFIVEGIFSDKSTNNHKKAVGDVRKKLYAINKWSNENNVDITIHIHFNDYAGRKWYQDGKYTGFSIYIPENQLPNHRVSKGLADQIKTELEKSFSKGNGPLEKETIIETQELIAVGAKGTRDSSSVLIEYGYIYEPQFKDWYTRSISMREMAYKTYLGVIGYFDKTTKALLPTTSLLPYTFVSDIKEDTNPKADVLRLQTALIYDGVYPPSGRTLSDCPVTGIFGQCTKESVKSFQEKYADFVLLPLGQNKGTGIVGEKTIEKLNTLFR